MPRVDLPPGERILAAREANIRAGPEYVEGRVILTTHRLLLRPNPLYPGRPPRDIPLSGIDRVEPFRQLGVLPTGLAIVPARGPRVDIIVWGRHRFLRRLRRAIQRVA